MDEQKPHEIVAGLVERSYPALLSMCHWLEERGMSYSKFLFLQRLGDEVITVGEVPGIRGKSTASASDVVTELAQAGLLFKVTPETAKEEHAQLCREHTESGGVDGRLVFVRITESGERFIREFTEELELQLLILCEEDPSFGQRAERVLEIVRESGNMVLGSTIVSFADRVLSVATEEASSSLRPEQLLALQSLPVRVGKLGKQVKHSTASATGQAKRLIELGYAEEIARGHADFESICTEVLEKVDKRAVIIRRTPAGDTLLQHHRSGIIEVSEERFPEAA